MVQRARAVARTAGRDGGATRGEVVRRRVRGEPTEVSLHRAIAGLVGIVHGRLAQIELSRVIRSHLPEAPGPISPGHLVLDELVADPSVGVVPVIRQSGGTQLQRQRDHVRDTAASRSPRSSSVRSPPERTPASGRPGPARNGTRRRRARGCRCPSRRAHSRAVRAGRWCGCGNARTPDARHLRPRPLLRRRSPRPAQR